MKTQGLQISVDLMAKISMSDGGLKLCTCGILRPPRVRLVSCALSCITSKKTALQ